MEITDVRMETFRWPDRGFSASGRWVFGSDGLDVIKIETSEGLTGLGLSWSYLQADSIGRGITEHYRPLLVGRNPLNNEDLWERMWLDGIGRRGIAVRILSAIDVALWDIKAKYAGMPLYRLLGGHTKSVAAYISLGYYGQKITEVIDSLKKGVAEGTRAIKIQIGELPIKEDVERIRIVRKTIGPDIKLMVDARCVYSHSEAIILAREIEKYDIFWFEEPVKVDNLKGYQLVAQSTSIPIASGEAEYTKYGFRDLIQNNCAAILQPDAMVMGGITEWMKVAAMAQAHHLLVSHHGPHQIHAHLLAAIPNGFMIEEYYTSKRRPIEGGIFKDVLTVVDGYISPPERPGLGMELNEKALAPHRTS